MKIEIPNFKQAKVLVVGDLMLDRYWHGSTSRISPEAPVPVVKVGEIEDRPGGSANVALNIAMLGGQVKLQGITGNDAEADTLQMRLESAGVECDFLRAPEVATLTKLRVVSRHQQLIRLDFEGQIAVSRGAEVLEHYHRGHEGVDLVILSDYGKGTLHDMQAFIQGARSAEVPVLIDPKSEDFSLYRGATLVTPNLAEFEAVVGPCAGESEIVAKGMALLEDAGIEALLVTRGEHGMTLLRQGAEPLHLPTRAREVFDVTGAGDTVIAVFGAALAAGQDMAQAMAAANLAAGIVVGKLGTATVTVPELQRSIHELEESWQGIISEAQLRERLEVARAHGEKIVMTNGCFDIIHAGHVAYLNQARRLGDRLIVAVNDDLSVAQLKGEGRPINALQERMEVLSALESVDWVVPFSDPTPARLIGDVLPDLLVKGGDYQPEEIAGYECVTRNGGEVRVLGFKHGFSTTKILDTLRAAEE